MPHVVFAAGVGSWEGAWPDSGELEGGPCREQPGVGFGLKHHLML